MSLDKSLLTLILDVSPSIWGNREYFRESDDAKRAQKKKASAGPARLDDLLTSTVSFGLAFASLHRENCLVIIGVADDEVAILYPRKDVQGLARMVNEPSEMTGSKIDGRSMNDQLKLGVRELVARAAERATRRANAAKASSSSVTAAAVEKDVKKTGAAIAAAMSIALCVINRFSEHAAGNNGDGFLGDDDNAAAGVRSDENVLAMMEGRDARKTAEERERRRRELGWLSPRILIVQASEDRTGDYNALMNGTFASIKGGVVIDTLFVPGSNSQRGSGGGGGGATESPFLQQACDRTGGVYFMIPPPAQVHGGLTEIMVTIFLPPVSARKRLQLPSIDRVDFRARCFETGESVDMAYVCNLCLSIFKNKPRDECPTCGATSVLSSGCNKKRRTNDDGSLVEHGTADATTAAATTIHGITGNGTVGRNARGGTGRGFTVVE